MAYGSVVVAPNGLHYFRVHKNNATVIVCPAQCLPAAVVALRSPRGAVKVQVISEIEFKTIARNPGQITVMA